MEENWQCVWQGRLPLCRHSQDDGVQLHKVHQWQWCSYQQISFLTSPTLSMAQEYLCWGTDGDLCCKLSRRDGWECWYLIVADDGRRWAGDIGTTGLQDCEQTLTRGTWGCCRFGRSGIQQDSWRAETYLTDWWRVELLQPHWLWSCQFLKLVSDHWRATLEIEKRVTLVTLNMHKSNSNLSSVNHRGFSNHANDGIYTQRWRVKGKLCHGKLDMAQALQLDFYPFSLLWKPDCIWGQTST